MGLGHSFLICPRWQAFLLCFVFWFFSRMREGSRVKGPSTAVSVPEAYTLPRRRKGCCGEGNSKRAKMSWAVLFCVFFIIWGWFWQHSEQSSGHFQKYPHWCLAATCPVTVHDVGGGLWKKLQGLEEGTAARGLAASSFTLLSRARTEETRKRERITLAELLLKFGSMGQWEPLWFSPWTTQ